MFVIFLIYSFSTVWCLFFIDWLVEHNFEAEIAMCAIFCPILNTIFAIYRTYMYFKNASGTNFIKNLFQK